MKMNDLTRRHIVPARVLAQSLHASVVRRVGGTTGRIAQHLAVRECDRQKLAAGLPVAQRMNVRLDFHPGRERLWQPALSRQAGGTVHLDRPLHCLALLILDVEQDPGMRVRPLELFDGALELDDLESIEHSEGMVRRSRNRNSNCGNARETECFEGHERLSRCFLVFSGYQSL